MLHRVIVAGLAVAGTFAFDIALGTPEPERGLAVEPPENSTPVPRQLSGNQPLCPMPTRPLN